MNNVSATVLAIVGGIITLTMLAVAVSKNAQTPQVLSSAGGALAGIIGAAVSPVTGSTSNMFGSTGLNALGNIAGSLGGSVLGNGAFTGQFAGLPNF